METDVPDGGVALSSMRSAVLGLRVSKLLS